MIQNNTGNIYAATTIVGAVTTTIKEFPVTVVVPAGEGGVKRRSMINLAQLLTIDKDRLQKRLGSLSRSLTEIVNEAIRVSLDM